jgi:arginine decarboxylase
VVTPLVDRLWAAARRDTAPFHVPGHKKGAAAPLRDLWGAAMFAADLTELPELDNLYGPSGVIAEAQVLAAQTFGADRTFFLTNGSTAGVIGAILATCGPGDEILLPRNVHRSALSGLILSGAWPVWLEPEPGLDLAGVVTLAEVERALALHPRARALLLVSPTYQGLCGSLGPIAQLAQDRGLPLLVDEAHGAHFGFHPELPRSALSWGADLVVQSTHKTLGSLTQSSMLHVQGDRLNRDRLAQALAMVGSSSPSYLLLASLDGAREQVAGADCQEMFGAAIALARSAVARIEALGLQVLDSGAVQDPLRLTLDLRGSGLGGYDLDDRLSDLGVIAELPGLQSLTFVFSLGTMVRDVDRLVAGLAAILGELPADPGDIGAEFRTLLSETGTIEARIAAMTPREAFFAAQERLPLDQTIGRVCTEIVCPYPPGIPVLLPGERVTAEAIELLQRVQAAGGILTGCGDPELRTLSVVAP